MRRLGRFDVWPWVGGKLGLKELWAVGLVWLLVSVSRVVNLHERHPASSATAWLVFTVLGAGVSAGINDLIPDRGRYAVRRRRRTAPLQVRLAYTARLTLLCAALAALSEFTSLLALAWVWVACAGLVATLALYRSAVQIRDRRRMRNLAGS